MLIEQFLTSVQSRAEGRFEVQAAGDDIDKLHSLAPEQLLPRQALKLRRGNSEHAGWRTFLVVVLEDKESIGTANRWAAEVRDKLLDPETADLYLFILIHEITGNFGADIESSELFCRKFVMRPNESIEALLDRTFLAQVFSQTGGETFVDPLKAALLLTAECHPRFTTLRQDAWRVALLSGKSGSDLADDLFSHLSDDEVA